MGQGSDNFDKEVTKAAILREARRVYGSDLGPDYYESNYGNSDRFPTGRHSCEIWYGCASYVVTDGRTQAEARRMALAALKAAGDAR